MLQRGKRETHKFVKFNNCVILFFICRGCAQAALEDTCKWLDGGGEVAVSTFYIEHWEPVGGG